MSVELLNRVDRILQAESLIRSRAGELIPVREILYIYSSGGVFAVRAGKDDAELEGALSSWEKRLRGLFMQTHRRYLVALDKIEGTYERFPLGAETYQRPKGGERPGRDDECEISLHGSAARIPVIGAYGKALKKALGITKFHYLSPENPDDRKLRLYGLIDFGWRELAKLDPADKEAVAVFKAKWDVKQFSRERMLSCFRQYGVNEINKKRVIKNIIYQLWRWIKKGIEPKGDGNIRSLWYQVKTVLAYHSDILEAGDVDTFYNTLQEMIEEKELFRYKDFGFFDETADWRAVGEVLPHVVLVTEKKGLLFFIQSMATAVGASYMTLKGEPTMIAMEYFGDELKEKCGGRPLVLLCVTDVDPAGESIQRNLAKGLAKTNAIERTVRLVDTSLYTDQQIKIIRWPTAYYLKKGDEIKPAPPTSKSWLTKALRWFETMQNDSRLLKFEDAADGWTKITIFGIEADSADRQKVEARFRAELEKMGAVGRKGRRKSAEKL